MLKLIENEIIKLLKKKSFYVVTIIFILFCILTNIVYKSDINSVLTEEIDISELQAENETLDLGNNEELLTYVENLTIIRIEELKREYPENVYLIENNLYNTVYHMYESRYIKNNQELYEEYYLELENDLNKIANNDYEYFLDERISYLTTRINETTDLEQERYNKLLELAIYRKENSIPYNNDNFLHNAIVFLEENTFEYLNLLNDNSLTSVEEERLSYLEEQMAINEYILETKEDVNNETTLRAVLINFSGEFGLFILIYVIMAAGSIVSEEYSRGTIKSLLTKPHKRSEVLTSKLLVVIFLIPIIMLFMSLIEIVLGGLTLGFDSLSIPVIIYNGTINTYSVIGYLFSLLLSSLPMYLVIGILSFMISTISRSTSAAITISFLFYLLGNIISNLALIYDLPIFKAFISLYWDFSYIITNSPNPYGASIFTSILIIILYLGIMLCLSYVYFAKKDVKNL